LGNDNSSLKLGNILWRKRVSFVRQWAVILDTGRRLFCHQRQQI